MRDVDGSSLRLTGIEGLGKSGQVRQYDLSKENGWMDLPHHSLFREHHTVASRIVFGQSWFGAFAYLYSLNLDILTGCAK